MNIWSLQVTSTCLHHSQLELPKQNTVNTNTRTINSVPSLDFKSSCQKNNLYNKKNLSISAQYKPIHNKSESVKKSCPLHKKKMKNPNNYPPYVTEHLIKTY